MHSTVSFLILQLPDFWTRSSVWLCENIAPVNICACLSADGNIHLLHTRRLASLLLARLVGWLSEVLSNIFPKGVYFLATIFFYFALKIPLLHPSRPISNIVSSCLSFLWVNDMVLGRPLRQACVSPLLCLGLEHNQCLIKPKVACIYAPGC